MELLIVGLAGLVIGAVIGAVVKHRRLLGGLLTPVVAAVTALLAWEALVWLRRLAGAAWADPATALPWAIALVTAAVVAVAVAARLAGRRHDDDEDLIERLAHVGRSTARV